MFHATRRPAPLPSTTLSKVRFEPVGTRASCSTEPYSKKKSRSVEQRCPLSAGGVASAIEFICGSHSLIGMPDCTSTHIWTTSHISMTGRLPQAIDTATSDAGKKTLDLQATQITSWPATGPEPLTTLRHTFKPQLSWRTASHQKVTSNPLQSCWAWKTMAKTNLFNALLGTWRSQGLNRERVGDTVANCMEVAQQRGTKADPAHFE